MNQKGVVREKVGSVESSTTVRVQLYVGGVWIMEGQDRSLCFFLARKPLATPPEAVRHFQVGWRMGSTLAPPCSSPTNALRTA